MASSLIRLSQWALASRKATAALHTLAPALARGRPKGRDGGLLDLPPRATPDEDMDEVQKAPAPAFETDTLPSPAHPASHPDIPHPAPSTPPSATPNLPPTDDDSRANRKRKTGSRAQDNSSPSEQHVLPDDMRYAGTIDLDDDYAPRVPVGSLHIGTVEMPDALKKSTERVLVASGMSRKELFEDASKLSKFITNRGFPDVHVPRGVVRPSLKFSETKKYSPRLVYGAREALAYLVARQPIIYANTARVLYELFMRDPSFKPRSVLDFGSGVGTAVWAAHEIFGAHVEDYNMVDSSLHMLTLAEQVLTDHETKRRMIPHVHMRQYISPAPTVKHDLVISAYSLSELPDQESRMKILETLWSKTRDALVVIEDGSPDAFHALLQARDAIIGITKRETKEKRAEIRARRAERRRGGGGREGEAGADRETENEGENGPEVEAETKAEAASAEVEEPKDKRVPRGEKGSTGVPDGMYVFGPCPHESTCPRKDDTRPCHFPQRAHIPQAQAFHSVLVRQSFETEKFSYMIFRRGNRKDEFKGWHRLLNPPKYADSHARIELCHEDGYLSEAVVSKKLGKKVWKDVRRREWGDLYPDAYLHTRDDKDSQ